MRAKMLLILVFSGWMAFWSAFVCSNCTEATPSTDKVNVGQQCVREDLPERFGFRPAPTATTTSDSRFARLQLVRFSERADLSVSFKGIRFQLGMGR